MAQRPSLLPDWATQNPSGVALPPQSQMETGWVPGSPPAAEYANWLQQQNAAWLRYLDQNTTTTALFTDLAISSRMVSQAIWSWRLAARTLAWDNTVFVAYPGAQDAANTIAAGSVVLSAGDCAYVQANQPFTTSGTLTSGQKTATNVLYGDQVQAGWSVTGNGVPSGTTVVSVDSDGATVHLSNAATVSAQNVQLTFGGAGTLTVQTAAMSALTPTSGTVILARATDTTCYVGIGSGQMRLHDGEKKGLLEGGYLDVRRLPAGQALTALQFVYLSPSGDGRTQGSLYPADATNALRAQVLGVNVTAHASGETAQVVTTGFVDGFTGLSLGSTYYLDPATPGSITTTKPTTVGQSVVPIGTAASSTALVLNANAAADASLVEANLTKSGTITGNSIVSVQGFRQQVSMGGFVQQSGVSSINNLSVVVPGPSGPTTAVRYWAPGASGSLLNAQLATNINAPGVTYTVNIYIERGANSPGSGTTLVQFQNLPFTAGVRKALWAPFTKGQYKFGAFDVLSADVTFTWPVEKDSNGNTVTKTAPFWLDLTVEMGA